MPTPSRTSTDPEEIADNLLSIEAIPPSVLGPKDLSHLALRWLAWGGFDAYAYASGGSDTGTWCAWIGPLADARSDKNGRVTIADWRDHWQALLAEAGIITLTEEQPQ